jgi:hypothetical protein
MINCDADNTWYVYPNSTSVHHTTTPMSRMHHANDHDDANAMDVFVMGTGQNMTQLGENMCMIMRNASRLNDRPVDIHISCSPMPLIKWWAQNLAGSTHVRNTCFTHKLPSPDCPMAIDRCPPDTHARHNVGTRSGHALRQVARSVKMNPLHPETRGTDGARTADYPGVFAHRPGPGIIWSQPRPRGWVRDVGGSVQ